MSSNSLMMHPLDAPQSLSVDYDHARNRHTAGGAEAALSAVLGKARPASLLDVGCGTGTWLHAAMGLGVFDICGLDGIVLPQDELHVARELIRPVDLARPFSLQRRFDVALCLEVGEHLPESSSAILVRSLTAHSDKIVFSAACPGQPGQHHINCRWPSYWQSLFNDNGFSCDDQIRWQIWDDARIERWYRQNIFIAVRNPAEAGREPRIRAVVHPELLPDMSRGRSEQLLADIEAGMRPAAWYLDSVSRALMSKIARKLR